MLSSSDLLAEMRRLKDEGRTTNADLSRLLDLPSARIAEIFDEKRRVTIDEMKLVVEHFSLGAASSSRLPDTIDKAPDVPRTVVADGGETIAIKTLDLSYAMGTGISIDDYIEEVETSFDVSFLRRRTRSEFGRLRLARGVGDSMFPTLLSNDVVLIDTTQNELRAQDGVYAIALYGAAAIKRLRRSGPRTIMVKSDNPAVDDQEVDASDIRIHGRVIWFGRDL